ncbi:metallopeptidase domain-containing protein [Pseudoxanthomonas japonensis]|uniref:M6 family metalloprotease domain-containing protein n=1 Tax=Pseudoxanthomonas japonensis TaxID=69284 RepID=A0ABQ6ZIV8_9GAMM|nr:hypothetical protein [Pseudoxanthomonas japonensis]KAF1725999.1 hypothetical protein CSC78_06875 [Pseudoxanthomonas japonensis]
MGKDAKAPPCRAWAVAVLVMCAMSSATDARAQAIEQGLLHLEWGDPPPVAKGQPRRAPQFNASLLKDDGTRIRLDPAQAKLAAGDLYVLANRRVAVAFAPAGRVMSSMPAIEAIVPVDRVTQSAPMHAANARVMAAAPISGTTRWVTLMCKFSDLADEQKDLAFFQSQYGEGVGQLGHYWREVSYNKINLTGSTAHGWYTLPSPRSTYVTTVDGKDKADLNKLFADCASAAPDTVDLTAPVGINMMFNGNLDGYAWGGQSCATVRGARLCKRVTWNPPWSFGNLAPLAHEMGHGYGLPHSDNSDGDDDTYDNPWDVMSDSWSNAVGDTTYGTRPKHINIFQRHRLSWVDAPRQQIVALADRTTRDITLDYAHLAGSTNVQMLVLSMSPQADPYATVVYTLEARKREGTYEGNLAGNAVIIHKVERSGTAYSIDADVPPANRSNNEGSMFKVGERWMTPEASHLVTVKAQTATGFVLTVGPARVMSTPLPPRLKPDAVAPSSLALPAAQPASGGARERTPAVTRCVAGGMRSPAIACAIRER